MRLSLTLATAFIALVPLGADASPIDAQEPLHTSSIQSLLGDFDAALRHRDAEAVIALFAADAKVETLNCGKPLLRETLEEFAKDLREVLPNVDSYQRTRSALSVLPIEKGMGAIVRSTATEVLRGGGAEVAGRSTEVTTLVRVGEKVRIRELRATEICD